MLVKDVMYRDVTTIDGGSNLTEAARLMSERKRGSLLVLESGRLEGIVTERDFVWKASPRGWTHRSSRPEKSCPPPS